MTRMTYRLTPRTTPVLATRATFQRPMVSRRRQPDVTIVVHSMLCKRPDESRSQVRGELGRRRDGRRSGARAGQAILREGRVHRFAFGSVLQGPVRATSSTRSRAFTWAREGHDGVDARLTSRGTAGCAHAPAMRDVRPRRTCMPCPEGVHQSSLKDLRLAGSSLVVSRVHCSRARSLTTSMHPDLSSAVGAADGATIR